MNSRLTGLLLTATLVGALSGCVTRPVPHTSSSGAIDHPEGAVLANPIDVDTIAHLVRASYETISGPAQNPWPWDRDRTLYIPQAIFVVNSVDEHGLVNTQIETPEEYRHRFISGTYETEIGRHIERFGKVAQVRSVSVVRDTPDGSIKSRWVNYFQVYWDGKRWWIAAMVWDQERDGLSIPESWIGKLDEDNHSH